MVECPRENVIMELDRLYELPFTDINLPGQKDVFPSETVEKLVKVLAEVRMGGSVSAPPRPCFRGSAVAWEQLYVQY
jgi:hypothetical protein